MPAYAQTSSTKPPATSAAEAKALVDYAEKDLANVSIYANKAQWVYETYINADSLSTDDPNEAATLVARLPNGRWLAGRVLTTAYGTRLLKFVSLPRWGTAEKLPRPPPPSVPPAEVAGAVATVIPGVAAHKFRRIAGDRRRSAHHRHTVKILYKGSRIASQIRWDRERNARGPVIRDNYRAAAGAIPL